MPGAAREVVCVRGQAQRPAPTTAVQLGPPVKLYLTLFRARLLLLTQYRTAAWAGVGTQLFWGLLRVMIFEALYRGSTAVQPLSLEQTISYIWLGQATLTLVMYGVEGDTRELIRSGHVAYELCRPADLYGLWYVRALAWRVAAATLRALPQLVLALLFLGLRPPATLGGFAGWLAATLLAALLSAAWGTLLTVTLLWTVAGDGIARLGGILPWFGSGLLIPLPLVPDWLQPLLRVLPFRGLADLPFRLWTGHLPASAALGVLAQQAAWTVALVLLGRWLLARGTRALVVQGG